MSVELLRMMIKVDIVHVAYKSAGPCGRIGANRDQLRDKLPTSMGHIRSGKVPGIAALDPGAGTDAESHARSNPGVQVNLAVPRPAVCNGRYPHEVKNLIGSAVVRPERPDW